MVQDKVQQLVLQGAIGVKDQGLETLPATRNELMTKDHQQVAEEHERLKKDAQTMSDACSYIPYPVYLLEIEKHLYHLDTVEVAARVFVPVL